MLRRSSHHPQRHKGVEHPADGEAPSKGRRLRVLPPGAGGPGRHPYLHPDQRHRRVRGPRVPPDLPAHRQERRLLIRRPPGGARHGAAPHRVQPRPQGARYHQMGNTVEH